MGQFYYNGLVVSLQRLFLVSLLITIAPATSALTVQTLRQADQSYTVITVDLKRDALQLFLHDNQGRLYQSFSAITQNLSKSQQLVFAMNAGMFHANYLPVGLYVEQAQTLYPLYPLNTAQGKGNFFMQPNGVFLRDSQGFKILSTADFLHQPPQSIQLATQSGPMLVDQSRINAQFKPDSTSRYIRNAVGIRSAQQAVFVISEQPVSFYELAYFFRQRLQINQALYLDGAISSLYLPVLKRHDRQRLLGPIIGVVNRP